MKERGYSFFFRMKREREDQEGVTDEMVKNTFREAAKTGNVETLVSLMDDPRVNLESALSIAARRGQVRVVRLLLADGRADPAAYRNSPLSNAARNGHIWVVRALMADSRVDPSFDDDYAIQCAAKENHLHVVRLLLQDPRVNPLRALARATRSGVCVSTPMSTSNIDQVSFDYIGLSS